MIDAYGSPIKDLKSGGFTKRELFAAMAMQGMLSSPNTETNLWCYVAEQSVAMADALLKELDR